MNCKISIIVPVYNGGKHLKQCLDSIITQTLKEIQIIIINDGSTDNSKEIISDYASKDARILFIESANEGVSAARNKGIEKATGKYVGFVDADDYIDETMYQQLFDIAEEKDASMVICNAMVVTNKVESEKRLQLKNDCILVSDKSSLVLDFLSFKYDSANWNKIYALQLIIDHHLRFDKNLAIWEDLLFNLQFIAYVNKMVTLSESLYYYRIHDASVMTDSKLLISGQYNLLYDAYVAFCNKNSFLIEKEVFVQERAQTCIANVFVLLKLRKINTRFFKLIKQFRNELKVLNPVIYTETRSFQRIGFNFYWLLKNKFYRLFAFLYISNYIIKNRT